MATTMIATGGFATGAEAATTTVTPTAAPDSTATVDAHNVINTTLENVSAVTASVVGTTGQIDQDVSLGTNTNFTVDGNDVLSSAIANNVINSLDPSVSGNDDGDGAASSSLEINTALVSSAATDNTITIDLDNLATVGLSASGNSIEADATVNNSSNTIAGDIPIGYASSTAGSSSISTGSPSLTAAGGLAASTVQESLGSSATASASGNEVTLDLISTSTQTLASAPALNNNTIAASIKGNSSDSTIDVQSGAPSIFAGTAVLTNAQLNTADLSGTNSDSTILATIDSTAGTNTLTGSLSVEGNTISSSASGNEALGDGVAGNRVMIADQVSVDGLAGTAATVDTAYNTLAMTSAANADLVIHNSQGNVGTSGDRVNVAATTTEAETGAAVERLVNGSISVSDNATTAAARGNTATSAFATGDNIASFSASVAVANQQTNTFANTTASVDGTTSAVVDPLANVEAPVGSTVAVNGNSFSATAYGNQVGQSATLDTVSLEFPATGVSLTGGTGPDGNVHATGSALVTSIQSQYSSNVAASDDSNVDLRTVYNNAIQGGTNSDDLTVSKNVQEAVAVGSSGSNALSLNTTVVDETPTRGAGGGVASVQIIADASAVTATSSSNAYIDTREQHGSDVALTDNLQRAVAYGGLVSNSLDVGAESATIDTAANGTVASTVNYRNAATKGFVLDNTNAPSVKAAFGLLNDQSTSATISATAGSDGSFTVALGDDTLSNNTADLEQGSSISNDRNAVAAAAYGNNASNGAELSVGNLDTAPGTFAAVMNVTNAQTVTGDTTITARATGEDTVHTYVGDKVSASSISTSDNTVQALAYGSLAGSSLTADATSIDTAATAGGGSASVTGGPTNFAIVTDGAFSVNSAQSQDGSITASLRNTGGTSSANILTEVANGNEATNIGSSIVSNGNGLSASATANRADNLLDLAGNTLSTTGSLTNFQTVNGSVSALIGIEGDDPQPAAPQLTGGTTNDIGSGVGYVNYNSVTHVLDVATNPLVVTFTGHTFTPAEVAYLQSLGYVTNIVSGANSSFTIPVGSYTVYPDFNGLSYGTGGGGLGDETISFIGFTAPTVPAHGPLPGSPNVGGVTVAVGGNLVNTTVEVNGNTTAGSVTGNSAANALSVSSTNDTGGSAYAASSAEVVGNQSATAQSDYSLTNWQTIGVGTDQIASEVYGTFAIDMNDASDITTTSLSVDGNTQSSRAVANNGSSTVDISATNLAAGSALLSYQTVGAPVSATSDLDIYAPAGMSGSSVSMSDNTNVALAVANNATNETTVEVTNADAVNGGNSNATIAQNTSAPAHAVTADHLLLNVQSTRSSASITADATTAIYNDDSGVANTDNIANSSVAISGNSTSAEASANRAVNSMDLAAGSSLDVSGAVDNGQANQVAVTASATTSAGIALQGTFTGGGNGAVLNSGVTLGGNSTTALARGNAASNSLNVSAGADYGAANGNSATSTIGSNPSLVAGTEDATFAVYNNQVNTGAVSASSQDASYLVALNGTTGNTAINATIGVIGNSVAAAAYGNTATNTLALAPLNTGMPTAVVGNRQYNSAAVTASVTTVAYGITSTSGAVTGSALGVTSNSITATAVGNNAISTLGAN
ncbi:MAG: hypothetical protein J7496_01665 [Novosphingobium sp.]|nr:hypothetical protein [Novosphingobium sp.]